MIKSTVLISNTYIRKMCVNHNYMKYIYEVVKILSKRNTYLYVLHTSYHMTNWFEIKVANKFVTHGTEEFFLTFQIYLYENGRNPY